MHKVLFNKKVRGKTTIRLVKLAGLLIFGTVISLVLFMVVASFSGWHFDIVPTGSMEPAFSPGGMVVTRPAELEEIKLGDPILFREPTTGGLICHRVIEIEEIDGELFFQTKGDANEYADQDLVSPQNFIGKTIFYIPNVGKIAYLLKLHETLVTLMGKEISVALLIITAAGLTIVGMEFRNIWAWTFRQEIKQREELTKKHRERLAGRKRRLS